MTEEELNAIATRIAMEELGPVVNVRREPLGYGTTHEVSLSLPFPYFMALSTNLETATAEHAERNVRAMCHMVKRVIAEGIKKQEAEEQEQYARDRIARRLAADA